MQLDLLSILTKISREMEGSQQDLLNLRDPSWRSYMGLINSYNTLSSDELSVVNGALEELDKRRLTLNDFRDKIIRNKIRVGEDATDK